MCGQDVIDRIIEVMGYDHVLSQKAEKSIMGYDLRMCDQAAM